MKNLKNRLLVSVTVLLIINVNQALCGGSYSLGTSNFTSTVSNYSTSETTLTGTGSSSWLVNGYGMVSNTSLSIGKGGANYLKTPVCPENITSIEVQWSGSTSYYLALQTTDGTELEAHQNSSAATSYTFNVSGSYTQLQLVGRRNTGTSNAEAKIYSVTVNYGTSAPAVNYTVTWKVNGSTYTTGSPTTNVTSGSKVTTLPTAPTSSACDGEKVFVGWTTTQNYSSATTAPSDLFTTAAGSPAIGANTTFYAVFANAGGDPNNWVKGSVSDLTAGQIVIIHDYSNNRALTTTGYSSSKIPSVNITPTDNKIATTSITEAMKWTVGVPASGKYTFSQGTSYLCAADAYLKFLTTPQTQWTLTAVTNGYNFSQTDQSTYPYINNSTPYDITSYTSSKGIFNIFIPSVTYTNYATTCAAATYVITYNAGAHGTCATASQNYYTGTPLTLPSVTAATHYTFDGWYTAATGGTKVGDAGGSYTPTETCTLYAHYTEATKHTVTWSHNGGTVTTTQVYSGEAVGTLQSAPSSCSSTYTNFVGWFTTAAGAEASPSASAPATQVTTSTTVTGDVTYYAVFSDGSGSGGSWTAVTSTDDLVAGETYAISNAATGGTYLSTYTGGNNFPSSTTEICSLQLGGSTGAWTFQIKDGGTYNDYYLTATSATDKNYLKAISSNDAYGEFTISFSSGAAVITCTGKSSHNILRYNSTNSPAVFSCYSSGQDAVYLQKGGTAATGYISTCCSNPATLTLTPAASTINLDASGNAETTIAYAQTGGAGGTWGEPTVTGDAVVNKNGSNIEFLADAAGTYTVSIPYTYNGCAKMGTTTITVTETPVLTLVHVGDVTLSANCGDSDTETVTLNAFNCSTNTVNIALSNAVTDNFWVTPATVTPTDGKVTDATITLHYTATNGSAADNHTGTLSATCNGTNSANSLLVTASKSGCTPATLTFMNLGSQVSQITDKYAGETATAPAAQTACTGYTWAGWSTKTTDITASDLIAAGGNISVAGNATYYAVYTEGEAAHDTTTLTLNATNMSTALGTGYAATNFSYEDITWGRSDFGIISDILQTGKGTTNGFWNTTAIPGNIVSVAVTPQKNSAVLTVGTTSKPTSNSQTMSAGSTTTATYSASSNYNYLMLCATSSGYHQLTSVVVRYIESGTVIYTTSPACCDHNPALTLTATTGNQSITANWTASDTTCGFTVKLYDSSKNLIETHDVAANVKTYTFTGLTNCTNYIIGVVSKAGTVNSTQTVCASKEKQLTKQPGVNYTVIYNYGIGTGTPATATVGCATSGNYSVTLPSVTGTSAYDFVEWRNAKGQTVGNAGASVTLTRDTILTAHFQEKTKYTVSFVNNGSTIASATGYSGSDVTVYDPFTKYSEYGLDENPVFTTCADYEFVGWTTEANKTTVSGTTTKPTLEIAKGTTAKTYYSISANVTLYALWKITEDDGAGSQAYIVTGTSGSAATISPTLPTGATLTFANTYASGNQIAKDKNMTITLTGLNTSVDSVKINQKKSSDGAVSKFYLKVGTDSVSASSEMTSSITTTAADFTYFNGTNARGNTGKGDIKLYCSASSSSLYLYTITFYVVSGTTTYYTNPVCAPKVSVMELCDHSPAIDTIKMIAPVSGTATATYTAYASNIEGASKLKYSITGTDRASFSLNWGSTYPDLNNGAAQQQFTVTYSPATSADAKATLRFYVEDASTTHSCDIVLAGSTCTPLTLSATSTTNSITINSTSNFGATDTLYVYNSITTEPSGDCGVYPYDSIYCYNCASKGGKYRNLTQGVNSLTITGGTRPVAKGTTYSYYSKRAACQSGVQTIKTLMPTNAPTITADHTFWEAIAAKNETISDTVTITTTNYSGTISYDLSGSGASMYTITSLGAGKYKITYTPDNTDPNPATANFHFTVDCTDYRATVALSGMTPGITVVEVSTGGFTLQTDVEGDPRIMLSYESLEGGGSAKYANDLFFSKYFEAKSNLKLIGIFNGTDHDISLADTKIIMSKGNTWTYSTNEVLDLSDLGTIPSQTEYILYSFTQPTSANSEGPAVSCVGEGIGWKHENWFPTCQIAADYVGDSLRFKTGVALAISGDRSMALVRNGSMIDLFGAGDSDISTGSADNSAIGKLTGTVTVQINGKDTTATINDDKGWYCMDGIDYSTGDSTALSTNRFLLIRSNSVVDGLNAVNSNTTDFETLCTEWTGKAVGYFNNNELAKGRPDAQTTCEHFQYVAEFDYNGYYTQFNPIREDGVNVTKNAEIEGGWDAAFDAEKVGAFTDYSCTNLKIDVNYISHDGVTLSREEQLELIEEGETDFDTVTVASTQYKVPIIVTGAKNTDNAIFNEYTVDTCRTCDVAILNGAVLTKVSHTSNERDSIRNFYVYAGGKFVTDGSHGTYHINSLVMRSNGDAVSSAWLAGDLKTTTSKIYHDKRIKSDKSYFFTLPFNCKISDIKQMNGNSLGTYDEAWGIAYYDGASRVTAEGLAADGRNWKTVPYSSTLEAGKGYIIKINSKYTRYVRFPMTLPSASYNESSSTAKTVDIQQYGVDAATAGTIGWNNVGWNLVGNPYLTYFKSGASSSTSGVNYGDIEVAGHYQKAGGTGKNTWEFVEATPTEIYVTYPADDAGSTYNQTLASNDVLLPFRSFFVQAKANGTLTFAISKRQQAASAPMRCTYAEEQRPKIMLTLTAEDGMSDETTLLISDDYTTDYEIGYDLAKWMVAQRVRPQLASVGASTKLAFNALPNSETGNIPLYMLFPKAGNYDIAVDAAHSEIDDVEHIYLLFNGDIVADLKSGAIFTHKSTKYSVSSKYAIRIERKEQETTTPIDQYTSDWSPMAITNQRTVRLEQLPTMDAMISIYDVTGKQLISTESNGQTTMQFTLPASGFYTIVVNTAFDQFTFKTVVK